MLVLNTLAPVFLVIAVGLLLQRSRFVADGFLKEASRLTYWVGLPALLFRELAVSFHEAAEASMMLTTMAIATAAVILASYVLAWLVRVPGSGMGTFVQAAFRGNLAFVGLPIVFALPDEPLAGGVSPRAAAVVVVGLMLVPYNVVSVVVLLISQHDLSWRMVRPLLKQLATTPPLVGTVAGIGFAMTGWTLPLAIDRAFAALGEMALPLGLLAVGGSLATVNRAALGAAVWAAALVKTALAPAIGWAVARAMGLSADEARLVMILMAAPTAVASYVVAVELKGDEPLASGTIVASTVLSIPALGWIIAGF